MLFRSSLRTLITAALSMAIALPAVAQDERYDPEARLKELGIELPEPPKPVANYVNGVETGNLIFLAGKGPRASDGTELRGKLGADLTIEQGYAGARQTAINQLAVLNDMLGGDLSRVRRVVKVLGMVNSAPDFVEQPAVINGFSDLIVEVFGERGKHARAAVGMASLPRGQAVEIEMIVEIEPDPASETNPLWRETKVRNYLPHMTTTEVRDLSNRTDLVIIPLGALEQHADHLPIGTDFLNGVERCKLIAQERDMLVAPVLMAGQSPYHMGFSGTIALSAETIIKVHMEAVESLIAHGFRRFILMNAHGGNAAITTLLADQINQTTAGVAVSLEVAVRPYLGRENTPPAEVLDRHAGTPETSSSLYLIPTLVDLSKARPSPVKLPSHLEAMLPDVVADEPTAKLVFLAEGLKAKSTGKKTSTAEMTKTGVWGERDPAESTLDRGRNDTRRLVEATVKFVDRWNELDAKR